MRKNRESHLASIILAAGEGTRMKSSLAKVLHQVAGLPMLAFPVRLSGKLKADPIVVVVGKGRTRVSRVAADHVRPGCRLLTAFQEKRLGTAHAVLQGVKLLKGFSGKVLILYGDVPGLSLQTLKRMLSRAERKGEPMVILSAMMDDPFGYGRIVRDSKGEVLRIVEEKDSSRTEKRIKEVNAGIYLVDFTLLKKGLSKIGNKNVKREFYLTDLVYMAVSSGLKVGALQAGDPGEIKGVNDRAQLADAIERIQNKKIESLLKSGVTLRSPGTVRLDFLVQVGRDTVIEAGAALVGQTRIGKGCFLGHNCTINNSYLGNDVVIGPGAVVSNSRINSGTVIRANSVIEDRDYDKRT
ncbi:MAG: bifunctional N-acetylglucosamine-1-phosphate uridyltransferase/glucosamine-1-phosphate acetyltransferase [Deltaproteobacteria bacterium]|nr:bifunctional N-acetylglucosamine-1-phosphate uridyltransferase/glucosamine-1-phosphate acetyltransferase [Deltaproteobacteria bacterium]